jgi:hypothetical protein
MGKRNRDLLHVEKAQEAGATFHETEHFAAVTVPAKGFQKLIRFVKNGTVWTHKDFKF